MYVFICIITCIGHTFFNNEGKYLGNKSERRSEFAYFTTVPCDFIRLRHLFSFVYGARKSHTYRTTPVEHTPVGQRLINRGGRADLCVKEHRDAHWRMPEILLK